MGTFFAGAGLEVAGSGFQVIGAFAGADHRYVSEIIADADKSRR